MKLVNVGGVLVERDSLRIAERVHDYDPNLTLQYLEEASSLDEPPFRVVERCPDGLDRVALTAWELDERILHRLYAADTAKFDIDRRITSANEKARANKKQRYQEVVDEQNEIIHSVLKSPKQSYSAEIPTPTGDSKKVVFE